MTDPQFHDLKESLREYHADVKRRLNLAEDTLREHHVAIHGRAGDDRMPGLNLLVQENRKFAERLRLGMGAAWAALVTIACALWGRR
jgi:hypothetical protein